MLGYVRGKVLSKNIDQSQVTVLAHRVGYEVTVPKNVFEAVESGATVSLWLHTYAREDALILYGFSSEPEKMMFRALISVSGLGPKTALAILSTHGAQRLPNLIMAKDADALSEAPGVGKKLAQKLVLDLASKMEKLTWITQLEIKSAERKAEPLAGAQQTRSDLSSALQHLGYHPNQIKQTLDKVFDWSDPKAKPFEELLKMALKEMSGRPVTHSEAPGHG